MAGSVPHSAAIGGNLWQTASFALPAMLCHMYKAMMTGHTLTAAYLKYGPIFRVQNQVPSKRHTSQKTGRRSTSPRPSTLSPSSRAIRRRVPLTAAASAASMSVGDAQPEPATRRASALKPPAPRRGRCSRPQLDPRIGRHEANDAQQVLGLYVQGSQPSAGSNAAAVLNSFLYLKRFPVFPKVRAMPWQQGH